MGGLGLTEAKAVRRNGWVAIAITRNEGSVQMRHHAHLIAERRQPGINRNPIRIRERQGMGVVHVNRRPALRDHRHPKRACLPTES